DVVEDAAGAGTRNLAGRLLTPCEASIALPKPICEQRAIGHEQPSLLVGYRSNGIPAPRSKVRSELLLGRRSRLRHQERHERGAKQGYRRHTQKCCRPFKIRGVQAKECSAERSTNS